MDLNVGDKIIHIYSSWMNETIKIKTIIKVNKASYKLDDETLIGKNMKRKVQNTRFSTVTETFELYTIERWNELKEKLRLRRYKEWVIRLEKGNDLEVEFMKKYLTEKGVK